MRRRIVLARSAMKAIDKLPAPEQKRVANAILALGDNPKPPGKKVKVLKAVDGELLRLRVGDKRVIYELFGEEIHILAVIDRSDLERWLRRR